MIHQGFTVKGVTFAFLSGDGVITRPDQQIPDNFAEIMRDALELYDVFQDVAFIVEMGHYDKLSENHIVNTFKKMCAINYPKSWITERMCDGYAGYLQTKSKKDCNNERQ